MQIETVRDILSWTAGFHKNLSQCMDHCANEQKQERAQMLLRYLADHEKKLATILIAYDKFAQPSALNTWCMEYLTKHSITPHDECDMPFANMTTGEIIRELESRHHQVVDLYRNLSERADVPSVQDLLDQIAQLERHEIMQMIHTANRLEDL